VAIRGYLAGDSIMAGRTDPAPDFQFSAELDGLTIAGFVEVSGLASQIEVIDYREGDEKTAAIRKLPGQVTYPNIVLKRGVSTDTSLYAWHREWGTGAASAKRKQVSIILRDRAGNEIRRWNVHNAWPSKWEGPTLNALGNEVAIETIELTHEGIDLA
jgi:phage tail-like protein